MKARDTIKRRTETKNKKQKSRTKTAEEVLFLS
jgi:hypothetical protein